MTIDLKKDLRRLYAAPRDRFVEVDVPTMRYLALDGHGDPDAEPSYAQAVQALYAAAYATRAVFTDRTGTAFVVGPLEGLWSSADPAAFLQGDKGSWDWTMLLPLPPEASDEDAARARATAAAARPQLPVARVRILTLTEGRSLQIMHIGSYDDEAPTLARLHHEVMPERAVTWNGRHHEIYLGDPRRTAPEKLRTILRQPVRPA